MSRRTRHTIEIEVISEPDQRFVTMRYHNERGEHRILCDFMPAHVMTCIDFRVVVNAETGDGVAGLQSIGKETK